MWLFTRHGFYSITRSRVEPDKVQIKARCKRHLQNLQAHFTIDGVSLLGEILETQGTDYRWQIIADPDTAQIVLARLAEEIDYPNLKDECHKTLPHDNPYIESLDRAWSTMYQLQRGAFRPRLSI